MQANAIAHVETFYRQRTQENAPQHIGYPMVHRRGFYGDWYVVTRVTMGDGREIEMVPGQGIAANDPLDASVIAGGRVDVPSA